VITEESKPAGGAGKLSDCPAAIGLVESLYAARHLICPRERLESKSDRSSGLTVGAAWHRSVTVNARKPDCRQLDAHKIGPNDRCCIPHRYAEPCVSEVLHGSPEVDEFPDVLGNQLLQVMDETQGRVRCPTGLLSNRCDIKVPHVGDIAQRIGNPALDDAEFLLGLCERHENVEP
jgi:hypothetical protein